MNDTIIKGATNQKYGATVDGKYSVMVTDSNGCSATSTVLNYTTTGINNLSENLAVNIYPNPFTNTVNIDANFGTNSMVSITIFDMTGRLVEKSGSGERGALERSGEHFEYIFDAAQYGGNGSMFIVKISVGNEVVTREIVRIR